MDRNHNSVLGQFTANISVGDKQISSTFHSVQGNHGSLLSYKTASDLVINVKVNQINTKLHLIAISCCVNYGRTAQRYEASSTY